jgi:NAD(P)-dependent dehydrogenase (short-subunit alcohol dehydrogenase family)
MKRFGTPEDIAAGVRFLSNPEASPARDRCDRDIDGRFGA